MSTQKARVRHPQPVAHQTLDYESDLQQIAEAPRTLPRTNEQLNLTVVQRHHPSVIDIVSIAPFVVVYRFSPINQQWEKRDIEGTLFVCRLTPSELGTARYCVIVLNRRGLENFVMELDSEEAIEVADPYLILQSTGQEDSPEIYGLWIFEATPETRTLNSRVIQDCATEAATQKRQAEEVQRRQVQDETHYQNQHQELQTQQHAQSELMGRQLSLKELFGQQREKDSAWSIKDHHNGPEQQITESAQVTQPIFTSTPDTDFFRSLGPLKKGTEPVRLSATSHKNALLELFRKP